MREQETTTNRVDLHCHSTASAVSKLGVSRALGLPECATPPEEAYELAKRRGMTYVTLTDHDTIDGAVELAERYEDAFVSEELTARFKNADQAVHICVWGITPAHHEQLQALAGDVEDVAAYLDENEIACALAHPFFHVGAPLEPWHRRRLAEIFPIWETRNGARARELNAPAAIYIDTHGGTGTGGSDDHAGVDIGRTYTETPAAEDWRGFLAHVRSGRCEARGDQGSAAKWAHAALAIAVRTLGRSTAEPDPSAVLRMAERVLTEGEVRSGALGTDLAPDDARSLVGAWIDSVGLEEDPIALMQSGAFTHGDLARRARRAHEKRLREVAQGPMDATMPARIFAACIPAVPYAPAAAFLGREKAKLVTREGEPRRVAIVADGIGGTHGVTRTLEQVREHGVPGFEVELIGTDRGVDRRLDSVAEVDLGGLDVGVPSLPAVVETLAEGRYDAVHVTAPGPAGIAAVMVAKAMELPLIGSYHSELSSYAALRTGDPSAELAMKVVLGMFYGRCDRVLSPSAVSDAAIADLGIGAARVRRWDRGVDTTRFDPALRHPTHGPERVDVLYAGRLAAEKGVDLLAEAFERARAADDRLHLVLAGGGPAEGELRTRLGEHVTCLGWLEGDALPRAYASADLFCFASQTDTFGQVILEAQASGLPVVAVNRGGPLELIQDGRTGVLCEPEADALAEALAGLARSRRMRDRLARGGLLAARGRTWARSMERLGEGWAGALDESTVSRRAA
ncbi:MAG: glycosyltransferase [Solirubrobacteraceae bacterium]